MDFKTWLESEMDDILGGSGTLRQIGDEKVVYENPNGISKYVSPHGSYRYVYMVDGKIISALQIVSQKRGVGIVARVTTLPEFERQGYASALLGQARKEFRTILPAEHLTERGRNWTQKNFRQRTTPE
jgi:predicted GNAT family acetyltransferase